MYLVFNHNGTLLGKFKSRKAAEQEAIFYRDRTRNGAYVDRWVASTGIKAAVADTPLVAVMRCYVASKLGDDIELPEEIGG